MYSGTSVKTSSSGWIASISAGWVKKVTRLFGSLSSTTPMRVPHTCHKFPFPLGVITPKRDVDWAPYTLSRFDKALIWLRSFTWPESC